MWVRLPLLLLAFGAGCGAGDATPDPLATDADKYRVILENAQVRVLAYHDEPGARTHLHRHPDAVVYALGPFKRRLTLANGMQRELSFAAGDAAWVPAQAHIGENIGSTATDVLLVELKR